MTNKKLPDLTAKKIADHARWFDDYEILREKNRLAIQKWRETKKIDRKKDAQDNKATKTFASLTVSNEISEQKKLEITEWKV